ncbi:MAG: hypothetical protein C0487_18150 [Leptothrix sp. (in: Bacteria)]|nr:hypothetical protein [Leptothrix sp. (in: b-proteobacteria)]
MSTSASVSVGHGPGTPRNEGTAKDRGTPVPDSNLTEIDPTEERDRKSGPAKTASDQGADQLLPGTKRGPAQPR